jgi:Serine carboxypeptidase
MKYNQSFTNNLCLQFGGRFGPSYVAYFEAQNENLRENKTRGRVSSASQINVKTLNIHNGCSDLFTQGAFYPEFAYNNTYNLQVINEQQYEEAKNNLTKPGGCFDLVSQCQELAQELDPHNLGNNAEVNTACLTADEYCYANVLAVYTLSGVRVAFCEKVESSMDANMFNSVTFMTWPRYQLQQCQHPILMVSLIQPGCRKPWGFLLTSRQIQWLCMMVSLVLPLILSI